MSPSGKETVRTAKRLRPDSLGDRVSTGCLSSRIAHTMRDLSNDRYVFDLKRDPSVRAGLALSSRLRMTRQARWVMRLRELIQCKNSIPSRFPNEMRANSEGNKPLRHGDGAT